MNNLLNQKFNRLLVLEKTAERKGGCIVWKCKCDCGNICYIASRQLTSGNTKSCGCLNDEKRAERIKAYNEQNRPNLIGKVFGFLQVLELTNKTSEKGTNLYYKCKCLKCGNITYVTGNNLQSGSSLSCGCLISKGEEKIRKILNENNIIFETQKQFKECQFEDTKFLARFDFYVKNNGVPYLIEYDGEQHFKDPKKYTGDWDILKIQQRDQFKNNWCKEHNIPLIRIPYTHLEKICLEDLRPETSQFLLK